MNDSLLMIKERIETHLKEAMKKQETLRLSVLRLLSTAIHNREIDKRTKTGASELTEEEVAAVLRAELKKRNDAAEGFEKGGRIESAEKERKEEEIIQGYLPAELSDDDLEKIVSEVVAAAGEVTEKDFGRVMGEAMKRLKGQASGERVSGVVKKFLQK